MAQDAANDAKVRPTLVAKIAAMLEAAQRVRHWAAGDRRRSYTVLATVAVLLTVTLGVWTYLAKSVVDQRPPVTLAEILKTLDNGEYSQASSQVADFEQQETLAPEDFGGPAFVLGAIRAHQAEGMWPAQRRQAAHLIAARYLQESYRRGFPAGRTGQGLFLLGRSLVESHQFAEAVPILERALREYPIRQSEIRQLLTQANMSLPTPDLAAALAHNSQELADDTLSPDKRAAALQRRGDILLRQGDFGQIESILGQLPDDVADQSEINMLRARLLIAQAEAMQGGGTLPESADASISIDQLCQQATTILRNTLATERKSHEVLRRAMYLIGRCYAVRPKESAAAIDQFARVRKLYPETPEGTASALAEAQLLQRAGRTDDAVAAYHRMLRSVGDPVTYHNPWLPLEILRRRCVGAINSFVDLGQYSLALSLVAGLTPTFDRTSALQLKAQVHSQWGDRLVETAAAQHGPSSRAALRKARQKYRHAATIVERLAQLQFATKQYPDQLWRAAHLYLQGQNFTHAARVLGKYLDEEAVARRPQALVDLGRAHLSIGNTTSCIQSLEECMELYPSDASVYEARILCSKAYRLEGDADRAKQLLATNLTAQGLKPDSSEWQRSLLDLARLEYAAGSFGEAAIKLEEYIERYPDAAEQELARYMAAEAYRHAADKPLADLASAVTENDRVKHLESAQQLLQQAIDHYAAVQRHLTRKSANSSLEPQERAVLRNCYLLQGDAHFKRNDYVKSLEVFRNASSLYQNEPVVLDAHLQIVWCHRRLGQLQEARGAIEQAKVVLARLPPRVDFTSGTSFDRDQWNRVLNEMSQW